MRRLLCILLLIVPVEISYSSVNYTRKPIVIEIVLSESERLDSLLYAIDSISIDSLKSLIAFKETSNIPSPYKVKNRYGMLGKYQFAPSTLLSLGYGRNDIKNFLEDEIVQEEAMNKLLLANYSYLKRSNLIRCVGKRIGGVEITLSGILAGSHLVGPASVKHYLNTGGSMTEVVLKKGQRTIKLRKVDANGTSIKRYLSILE